MQADGAGHLASLRVDGGMAANDWFCQFLADILDITVGGPPIWKPPRWAPRCWPHTPAAPGPTR
jgi:hypothetical protein